MRAIYKSYTLKAAIYPWLVILLVVVATGGRAADLPVSMLKAFGPYPFLFDQQVVATNGMELTVQIGSQQMAYDFGRQIFSPPIGVVRVTSHLADTLTCVQLPASYLCSVVLLDDKNREVEKTEMGKTFGRVLGDDVVRQWCDQWVRDQQGDGRQTILFPLRGTASLRPNVSQVPVQICCFSLLDVFKVTTPGDYELRVQLRLVQSAKDASGNFRYPVMVLPQAITRVRITAKDLASLVQQ